MVLASPLILTLKLDSAAFDFFNRLRQQYFPVQRNFLPAHVTLFHALPGDQEANIGQTLQNYCSEHSVLDLIFPKLRFLGRGVAIEIDSPELVKLRNQLAQTWAIWLNAQDQQAYRPHITIQNKVNPSEARQLYEQLTEEWKSFEGHGEGLLLWHYQGGPWKLASEFNFGM